MLSLWRTPSISGALKAFIVAVMASGPVLFVGRQGSVPVWIGSVLITVWLSSLLATLAVGVHLRLAKPSANAARAVLVAGVGLLPALLLASVDGALGTFGVVIALGMLLVLATAVIQGAVVGVLEGSLWVLNHARQAKGKPSVEDELRTWYDAAESRDRAAAIIGILSVTWLATRPLFTLGDADNSVGRVVEHAVSYAMPWLDRIAGSGLGLALLTWLTTQLSSPSVEEADRPGAPTWAAAEGSGPPSLEADPGPGRPLA